MIILADPVAIKDMKHLRPFFYGLAELSPTAIDLFLKVYLLLYFTQIRGLNASGTSAVIGVRILWDALIDPWIGAFSDRFKEKHGNRRLLLYIAVAGVALSFYGLWRIPTELGITTYLYLFIFSAVLNSSLSLFSVPFYAIANDLEKDNSKRRTWIGWRLIFFNLGSIIGLSIPAYYLTQSKNENLQQLASTTIPYLYSVSALVMMTVILSGIAIFGMYYQTPILRSEVRNQSLPLRIIFKDYLFVQVLAAFFIVNCGLGLNSTLALFYYKEFLQFSETQTQTIIITFLIVFTLSIPLWVWLTRNYSKKNLIIAGALTLGIVTVFAFPNFRPDQFYVVLGVASLLCGVLVGVAVVMEIYLADFLNQKEEAIGQSISGQFLGLWKMASKISRAIAISLAGPIIEISAGRPQVLANYFGGAVGLFFISAGLIFIFPIKSELKKLN